MKRKKQKIGNKYSLLHTFLKFTIFLFIKMNNKLFLISFSITCLFILLTLRKLHQQPKPVVVPIPKEETIKVQDLYFKSIIIFLILYYLQQQKNLSIVMNSLSFLLKNVLILCESIYIVKQNLCMIVYFIKRKRSVLSMKTRIIHMLRRDIILKI